MKISTFRDQLIEVKKAKRNKKIKLLYSTDPNRFNCRVCQRALWITFWTWKGIDYCLFSFYSIRKFFKLHILCH